MSTLNEKTILLISPESWDHIFVSKHHYAIELSKTNNVFFLNPPSGYWRLLPTDFPTLSEIHYIGFWKGLHLLPKFLRRINQRQVFRKLEKLIGTDIDIVWSFDNSVFYDFDALPDHVLKISHIVDYNMDYQSERATSSADICFSCTEHILEKQLQGNANSFFINHGLFRPEVRKFKLEKKQLAIGYAGNLNIPYIDWEVLNETFRRFPDVNFFFAGSGTLNTKAPNASAVGKLDKATLFGFYEQMDILIIAYRADDFPKQLANPHKMMEYLSTGKPIVCTFTSEYQKLNGLIAMAFKQEEWLVQVREVLENLSDWNSNEKREKRMHFAMDHLYSRQLSKIDQLISNSVSK